MEKTMEQLTQTPLTNPNTSQQQNNPVLNRELFASPLSEEPFEPDPVIAQMSEVEPVDRQLMIASSKEVRRPKRLRRVATAAGMFMGIQLSLLGASCNPDPVNCPLSGSAAAEECWDENTGVLRNDGSGTERYTTDEAIAALPVINGDVTLDQPGQILERVFVNNGCIAIKASGVIVRNVVVRSDHNCNGGLYDNSPAIISTGSVEDRPNGSGVTDAQVTDSVIIGLPSSQDLGGIGANNITAYNNDISGVNKGMRFDYKVNFSSNYVHDLAISPIHSEGIFGEGGWGYVQFGPSDTIIQNNWIRAQSEGANTGGIAIFNQWPIRNVAIVGNYVDGAGNGVALRGGAYINKPSSFADHLVVQKNVFETNKIGEYSSRVVEAFCNTCEGNTWGGPDNENTDENGNVWVAPVPIVG